MKSLITLLLISNCILLRAQDWCHQGSKWTYGYINSISVWGYMSLTYEKDTVISAQSCQELTSSGLYDLGDPDSLFAESIGLFYTFSRNDTVFFFRDGTFVPVYYFNAAAGDTIMCINYDSYTGESGNGGCQSDTIFQIIDSVGTDTINSHVLRYYVAHAIDTAPYPFVVKVMERLGCVTNFMEPFTECYLDGPAFSFRCYEDDSFPTYQLMSQVPCDYVNSIEKPVIEIPAIYPNPATDYTFIDYDFADASAGSCRLEICNTLGQIVYTGPLTVNSGSQRLDVSSFASGIYAVCIKRNGVVLAGSKLVKQ